MKDQQEFIEEFMLLIDKIETADCIDKDVTPWVHDLCILMRKYNVCKELCDGIIGG
jgi:hypothetical protein